jgi:hypothetical protein
VRPAAIAPECYHSRRPALAASPVQGSARSHALQLTKRLLLATLFLAGAASLLTGQLATRPLGFDDLARTRSVGNFQVSPDGRWVAYTVGTTDAGKDKHDTDLYMVAWDGSRRVRLTATPESSESQPR